MHYFELNKNRVGFLFFNLSAPSKKSAVFSESAVYRKSAYFGEVPVIQVFHHELQPGLNIHITLCVTRLFVLQIAMV